MWELQMVFTLSHDVFTIEVWSSIDLDLLSLTMCWVYCFKCGSWIYQITHWACRKSYNTSRNTSGAEDIASNARRDSLTPEQREEMNARRRASRQNKTIEDRNSSQSAARQNLTTKERQEMNAHRRAASKNIPVEQRQEMNARRRARRQSIPPDERKALRAQRNADLAAKRKTPYAECIAMPCPYAYL